MPAMSAKKVPQTTLPQNHVRFRWFSFRLAGASTKLPLPCQPPRLFCCSGIGAPDSCSEY